MGKLTGLQKAAIKRAIDCAENLSRNISAGGKCELDDSAYDFASLELLEIQHWLQEVIDDSLPQEEK